MLRSSIANKSSTTQGKNAFHRAASGSKMTTTQAVGVAKSSRESKKQLTTVQLARVSSNES